MLFWLYPQLDIAFKGTLHSDFSMSRHKLQYIEPCLSDLYNFDRPEVRDEGSKPTRPWHIRNQGTRDMRIMPGSPANHLSKVRPCVEIFPSRGQHFQKSVKGHACERNVLARMGPLVLLSGLPSCCEVRAHAVGSHSKFFAKVKPSLLSKDDKAKNPKRIRASNILQIMSRHVADPCSVTPPCWLVR